MNLAQLLNLDNLDRRVAEGYIVERRGPNGLRLWNYTAKAQYERAWDNETRRCRGLVATETGYVVARPFEKFFNASEHETLPSEPFEVFEKLDGSLICVSQWPLGLLITSRGSFDSEHAQAARRIWTRRYVDAAIPAGQTWCFELIAPWNRIVVDYGDREDLVLLAILDNETGRDLPHDASWPGPSVRRFAWTEFDEIVERLSTLGPGEEGYVIHFASGLRVKLKGDEYVRLHRMLFGMTARGIWEMLAEDRPLAPLLERVPGEFRAWARQIVDRLTNDYAEIEREARAVLAAIEHLPTRKAQALAIAQHPGKAIIFRMLDGKPYAETIWRALYPAHERPFRSCDDA